jgi:hypothetical protein
MTKPGMSNYTLFIDLLKDPDRKSLPRILREILLLSFYHCSPPQHYFSRYLFKKGAINVKDYFPGSYLYKIKSFYNDKEVIEVLENKLYFNFYYSQFGVSLPKVLMYNHNKLFVIGNSSFTVNSTQHFKLVLEQLFNQNPSYDSIIIKRTYGSYGGRKVFKLFRHQLSTEPAIISELYSEVTKAGFLFQETIIQLLELNKLNPSCLNTIRFDTFIGSDQKIEIISGYIRMSVNNYHVDNISSGGVMVGINLENGRLKKCGYSSFRKFGTKVLTAHPVTNTVFEDFSIPFFQQAKELVIRAASFMPGLRLVGWDVAIGESGPVLIEGNSDYEIAGNDLADGGYRANVTFRKALSEINYL